MNESQLSSLYPLAARRSTTEGETSDQGSRARNRTASSPSFFTSSNADKRLVSQNARPARGGGASIVAGIVYTYIVVFRCTSRARSLSLSLFLSLCLSLSPSPSPSLPLYSTDIETLILGALTQVDAHMTRMCE
jgi:hypothetical protein